MKTCIIEFIGNKSHGEVTKNDINLFKQNYEEHCKTKNPSLIKSIELAKKLYQEKTKDTKDKDLFLDEKEDKDKKFSLLNKKRKDTNNACITSDDKVTNNVSNGKNDILI